MKYNFCFVPKLHKILIASATRMLLVLGEGGLEIKNQGRLLHSISFSQETGAIGQHKPRIGDERPKLLRELSAWMRFDFSLTPHFFSLGLNHVS